jgi:FKBP-type peptidyl-prolyl cis-trans isomerase SlyD
MDKKTNKFINVAYELYDVTEANATLIEKTSTDNPFIFISGFGVTLEDFEKAVENLNEGEEFDFHAHARAGLWRLCGRAGAGP